jgi:transposase
VFKNDLVADRSYLRNDHTLLTYIFLNLLSLYLRFQILNIIDGKHSVRNVLLILSRIKMYKMKVSEIMREVPKKSRELVEKPGNDLSMFFKN